MTTHLWREGEQRKETTAEYEQRVAADLARSRMRLAALGAKGPRILTWPYGEHNETADHIAASVGYSSFLEFGNSTFAFPGFDNRAIRRISVTRADETIPLAMPQDAIERQRWWLSFLKCARSSKSVDLIDAAIEQLEGEQQAHPEAELSRAAAEALRGHSAAALARIGALKRAYPHDGAIHAAIDELLSDYSKVL